MKKIILPAFIATTLVTTIFANSNDYADKIAKLHTILSGNAFEFTPIKAKDGYDIKISSKNAIYKDVFNPNAKIHISVDEGPLITSPSFGFGKAGLKATGAIADIFNDKIASDIKKNFKDGIKYDLTGKVSFGDELKESIKIEPLSIADNDAKIEMSQTLINLTADLDKMISSYSLKLDSFKFTPANKPKEGVELKDVFMDYKGTQAPIDGLMLFGTSKVSIGNILLKVKTPKKDINISGKLDIVGDVKKVDKDYLDFIMKQSFSTEDKDTIALSKGVKAQSFDLELKNLGIKGMVDFMKLSKEQQELSSKMVEASKKNDDVALQKAIVEIEDINNKLVPIFNELIKKDKTKIVTDLELTSDKTSFVKLNLTYEGKPLQGNINSAFITLAAQGLNLFNGDINIKLDGNLANSLYPMSALVLGMLQSKGFATMKNGVYELNAKLKDGKVLINGKSYTLQELTRSLF